IAFHIGSFGVRWYGLMYLGGFIGGLLLGEYRRRRGRLPVDRDSFLDLAFYIMLGVIVGGRIWYMLTYQPINWVWKDPLQLFRVWDGGMSFRRPVGSVGREPVVVVAASRDDQALLRRGGLRRATGADRARPGTPRQFRQR